MLAARSVKSTGNAGFVGKKPTTTGAVVPGVNAGMKTVAFVGVPITVSDCSPVPALTWSIVTVPGPLETPNETIPPGKRSPSVTVVVGVQVSARLISKRKQCYETRDRTYDRRTSCNL